MRYSGGRWMEIVNSVMRPGIEVTLSFLNSETASATAS
jgi:hypothetical protein